MSFRNVFFYTGLSVVAAIGLWVLWKVLLFTVFAACFVAVVAVAIILAIRYLVWRIIHRSSSGDT